jgi:DNA-binding MarR family transcriptional regulator
MAPSTGGDHEYPAPEEWQSWNAVLHLHRSVVAELDRALRLEHGLAVTEFDVLITLFNAPDRRLGMTALSAAVQLSQPGVTHLVTRLERGRLVLREGDPADRRRFFAVLTPAGDEVLRAARGTHDRVLRDEFHARLSPGERAALAGIWQRLTAPADAAAPA